MTTFEAIQFDTILALLHESIGGWFGSAEASAAPDGAGVLGPGKHTHHESKARSMRSLQESLGCLFRRRSAEASVFRPKHAQCGTCLAAGELWGLVQEEASGGIS